MSDNLQFGIALVCGFIVFIYSFIRLFIYGKTQKQRFIEKAKEKGWVTEGIFVDFKRRTYTRRSRGRNRYRRKRYGYKRYRYDILTVKYEYFVNGKSYYKKLKFQIRKWDRAEFPHKVKVYFDPKNPKKAVCPQQATEAHQKENGCLLTILFTIATIKIVYELIKRIT